MGACAFFFGHLPARSYIIIDLLGACFNQIDASGVSRTRNGGVFIKMVMAAGGVLLAGRTVRRWDFKNGDGSSG
jgi:hypothetical protein